MKNEIIYKEDAIEAVCDNCPISFKDKCEWKDNGHCSMNVALKELLPAKAVSFEDAMQIRNTILVKEYLRGRRDAEAESSIKTIQRQINEHWYLDEPPAEAVQDEWIDTGNWMGIECSRCKCHSRYVTPFCPQCGARMKGGENK